MTNDIRDLVAINNQFYPGAALSLSMGLATSRPGERLEQMVKRADAGMYEAKRRHYAKADNDRRLHAAAAEGAPATPS